MNEHFNKKLYQHFKSLNYTFILSIFGTYGNQYSSILIIHPDDSSLATYLKNYEPIDNQKYFNDIILNDPEFMFEGIKITKDAEEYLDDYLIFITSFFHQYPQERQDFIKHIVESVYEFPIKIIEALSQSTESIEELKQIISYIPIKEVMVKNIDVFKLLNFFNNSNQLNKEDSFELCFHLLNKYKNMMDNSHVFKIVNNFVKENYALDLIKLNKIISIIPKIGILLNQDNQNNKIQFIDDEIPLKSILININQLKMSRKIAFEDFSQSQYTIFLQNITNAVLKNDNFKEHIHYCEFSKNSTISQDLRLVVMHNSDKLDHNYLSNIITEYFNHIKNIKYNSIDEAVNFISENKEYSEKWFLQFLINQNVVGNNIITKKAKI